MKPDTHHCFSTSILCDRSIESCLVSHHLLIHKQGRESSTQPTARGDRNQQSHSRNTYDSFTESKPSELIELRRTLTQLNNAVTQVARSGNLEQANRVRDLLVQVKREIYKLLAE